MQGADRVDMVFEIRQATEADIGEITRIYNFAIEHTTATFDIEPKTIGDRLQWFRARTHAYPIVVATIDDQVVGWGEIKRYGDRKAYRYTVENAVYVDPDHQGEGIGTELLRRLIDIAAEKGYHTIMALIVGGNESSVRLHKKYGFQEVGIMREVGWKFDMWLDVVIMQKMLNSAEPERE